MTKDRKLEIKVGLFVVATLLLGAIGVLLLGKSRHVFEQRVKLRATFADVGGLVQGAPVRVSGVNVGTVAQIQFVSAAPRPQIVVEVEITQSAVNLVRTDSVARISSQGLLGDKIIEINAGSTAAPALERNGEIKTAPAPDLDKMLQQASTIIDDAKKVADRTAAAFDQLAEPKTIAALRESLVHLHGLLHATEKGGGLAHALFYDKRTADELTRLETNLSNLTAHVDRGVQHLDAVLGAADGDGKQLLNNVSRAARSVGQTADEVQRAHLVATLGRASGDLAAMTGYMKSGQGTLGALVVDPTVYEQLVQVLGGVGRSRVLRALVRYAITRDDEKGAARVVDDKNVPHLDDKNVPHLDAKKAASSAKREAPRVRSFAALLLVAGCHHGASYAFPEDPPCPPPTAPRLDVPLLHGDRARLGWNAQESALTPATVAGGAFGRLWSSPPLDPATVAGTVYAPHLYASPLYVDGLTVSGGDWDGATIRAVIAASSNARIYAISACGVDVGRRHLRAGTIVWATQVATPDVVPGLDGGVPLGVLSTPAIDLAAGRLYAAAMDVDAGWQVVALELASGRVLPGWPLPLTDGGVNAVNRNGPTLFQPARIVSQRGALNLSQSGDRLYVPFGAYGDKGAGWMIAVDTASASVAAAFSSGRNLGIASAYGGMWGAGGPAVAADDRVFVTTGNAPDGSGPAPNLWGESLLAWTPSLALTGTYTPWNYCQLDTSDADLGGSSPLVVPDLDPSQSATPHPSASAASRATCTWSIATGCPAR